MAHLTPVHNVTGAWLIPTNFPIVGQGLGLVGAVGLRLVGLELGFVRMPFSFLCLVFTCGNGCDVSCYQLSKVIF